MKLIVNSNRIIAALIRDSASREILLSERFNFTTVKFSIKEVQKYKKVIIKKAKINEAEFLHIMNLLLDRLDVIDETAIRKEDYLKAKEIMDKIDEKDTPFIAAALSKNSSIWSDDGHFKQQNKIRIWTTKQLIRLV